MSIKWFTLTAHECLEIDSHGKHIHPSANGSPFMMANHLKTTTKITQI